MRSKVEHVFGVLKLKFGFVKVRYRGLAKNANRLFATFALVNLFLVRRKLLSRGGVVSRTTAPSCGKGTQGKEISPITELPLGTTASHHRMVLVQRFPSSG